MMESPVHTDADPPPVPADGMAHRYLDVRRHTEDLCRFLTTEDYGVQAMPDASPPKWHLAHTTWFFETFILLPWLSGYRRLNDQYEYLFNSYYNGVGPQWPRDRRGTLSRPTVAEIYRYRRHVDEIMAEWLDSSWSTLPAERKWLVITGIHHEQQHQELLLTDLKYNFGSNPLYPCCFQEKPAGNANRSHTDCPPALSYRTFRGGRFLLGATRTKDPSLTGFVFDNECPAHCMYVEDFKLSERLVTNGEYLEFIADGGYRRPELWLSEGWCELQRKQLCRPLYWIGKGEELLEYQLGGPKPLMAAAPICHLSLYEADAYARWKNARLPTEAEWEYAACSLGDIRTPGSVPGLLHPQPANHRPGTLQQMFGALWQWTSSAYSPYPGYRPWHGTVGEYNGKFMCNQFVLRGSSIATPEGQVRRTYRNFFYPADRWQFTGLRLARDC